MEEVILYSTHCPKCTVLEMKLKQSKIDFKIVDNIDEVVEVGKKNKIYSAPILKVGENIYNFDDAILFLKRG